MDLAPVDNLDNVHDAAIVKTLITADEDGDFGIGSDHRFEGLFKVGKGRRLIIEKDVICRIHRDRVGLIIFRRERIGLGLWQHDGDALFESREGHDEGDEQEEGEVNERRHIDSRFWLLAPHATTSRHISQPFLGIRTRCARGVHPQNLPCRK